MGISSHVTTFANRRVEEFDTQIGIADPVGTAYALRCEYNEGEIITDRIENFLKDPQASSIEALVFGMWNENVADGDSSVIVNALVAASDRLKNLKALFIGDITYDESEISWIVQSNISPILEAYPNLEVLRVRGGENLSFSPARHDKLKALIVETGGLRSEVITQILALHLPALEHLELWLGREDYGGDSSIATLRPILDIQLFPELKYLGLRDSEYSDDIAEAVVNSSAIQQIKVLDLSLGTLGDEGAEALLKSAAVNRLEILNVSDNFLSEGAIARLKQLNIQVMADNQKQEEDEEEQRYRRYCSVAE